MPATRRAAQAGCPFRTCRSDAIARAMRAEPAIFALIVDAKDEVAVCFYEHLGFHRFASRPSTLFLPIAEAARRIAASHP